MRLSRGLVQILSVAAVVAIMSPAEAQTSSPGRIVAFGDSLTDNGNLFATSGNPPAPYFQGRSSNGPTWVEILAGTPMNSPIQGTGVSGNVNLAFAGALAGPGVNLNGPIPSVTQQIAIYQGAGGTFANTGVVALWGGANNVLQYFASNGFGAGITQAGIVGNSVAAATTMAGNVTTVVKSGAKTVLVANLPDLAAAPAFNTNPAAQPGVTLGANAFNSALFTGLGLVAAGAPGVNVVYMDVNKLINVVLAHPGAYGFTNTVQPCFNGVTVCANPNTYLFWDSVHPTAAGHRLLALYASLLLDPAPGAVRTAILADVAARGRMTAADDAFDRTLGWARGQYGRQNGAYVNVTGLTGEVNAHDAISAYRLGLGGARAGIDHAYGNVLVGGSAGVSTGSIGGNAITSGVNIFDADLYATALSGPFYVAGSIGASWTNFNTTKRWTGFGPEVAVGDSDSIQASFAGEFGVIGKVGAVTLIPAARIQFIHAKVSAYTETGLLAMAFDDHTVDAAVGGVRLKAATPIGGGTGFGEIGYEKVLSGNDSTIRARFVDNTALPFQASAGALTSRGLSAKVGYEGKVNDTTSFAVSYGAAVQDGNGVVHSGQAQVKVPF